MQAYRPHGACRYSGEEKPMMMVIAAIAAVLLAGSLVFSVLVVLATRSYLRSPLPKANATPAISVLKPLCGLDEGLEDNLRSFFEQNYPVFEVLLGVHREDDAATPTVRKIIEEYRGRKDARLVVTGE